MGAFEYFPREIWEIILFYGGNSVKKGRVMAVNKHWYIMFLSITFTAPFIRLSCDRSKYHDIVNSPFRPGQWTTSITFRFFKAERDTITQGKLYRLMKCTPHVEQINFNQIEIVDEQDWNYFYEVLKLAGVWKLRCLPDDWKLESVDNRVDMKSVYSAYLKCAQHLRDSLGSLRLIKEMMPTNTDLSFVNGFTALTPHLEELEVDFKDTSFDSDDYKKTILNVKYPSIKILTFHNFVFETDNQVSMIYTHFTGLKKLSLACSKNKLVLKPETSRAFFSMLSSLLNYNILFRRNTIDVAKFINEYCQQEMHATAYGSYIYDDSILVSKTKSVPKTMIKYKFYTEGNTDHYAAKRILSDLGPSIQQVELLDLEDETIQEYLKALFSIQHKTLHSIVFNALTFETLVLTGGLYYTSYLQCIMFDKCTFSKQALQALSGVFTNIDSIHFKGCHFDESFDRSWVNIIMPKTEIHNLCISYNVPFSASYNDENETLYDDEEKIEHPRIFPLVSITLTGEGVTRYYYTRDENVPVVIQTTELQFYLLADEHRYLPFIRVVNVQVKSIGELSLKLSNNRSKDIQMNFKC
ncbi:uncharacterized protein EV154DRAFT_495174 [Mucor mucedo]|uniref:uncharacterized protein n=1 Tax=Mucor mucedo TaxID=29922 RepID=UPI0022207423|nr:uncharacterized protein EV154DRAFT_495174 [Mucor mucedo]KAI7895523.1 hypothetical protein EV154DRAFT_495174 [Mucor mucedo]